MASDESSCAAFFLFERERADVDLTPMRALRMLMAVRELGEDAPRMLLLTAVDPECRASRRWAQLVRLLPVAVVRGMLAALKAPTRSDDYRAIEELCIEELHRRVAPHTPLVFYDELSQVCDHICISGEDVARDVPLLYSRGVTAVLNVACDRAPSEVRRMYKAAGIECRHAPMVDGDVSLADVCTEAHAALTRAKEQGAVMLVHCQLGKSRSVAVVVWHLMALHRESYATVMEARVLPARQCAEPNESFERQLAANNPPIEPQ